MASTALCQEAAITGACGPWLHSAVPAACRLLHFPAAGLRQGEVPGEGEGETDAGRVKDGVAAPCGDGEEGRPHGAGVVGIFLPPSI